MDLLEYQGKQLFARHGIPVPDGRPATTVDEAVAAADGDRLPVRRQGAGRRSAAAARRAASRSRTTRHEARAHADAILGMDIRGFTVHELWVEERLADRGRVLRLGAPRPLAPRSRSIMLSTRGGMDIEAVAEEEPERDRHAARRPAARLPGLPRPPARLRGRHRRRPRAADRRLPAPALRRLRRRGGDARRGQPAHRHAQRRHRRRAAGGPRARRQGDPRRQRALPPPGERRAARRLGRGPAGADGQGARADLRQARRRHRHPRQRRRAGHVDARRRRAATAGGRRTSSTPAAARRPRRSPRPSR